MRALPLPRSSGPQDVLLEQFRLASEHVVAPVAAGLENLHLAKQCCALAEVLRGQAHRAEVAAAVGVLHHRRHRPLALKPENPWGFAVAGALEEVEPAKRYRLRGARSRQRHVVFVEALDRAIERAAVMPEGQRRISPQLEARKPGPGQRNTVAAKADRA